VSVTAELQSAQLSARMEHGMELPKSEVQI